MIKEYYDTFLKEDATEKLSKDIEANPGSSFEIVGYTQVVVNDFFIRSSILVQWGNNFKESEWENKLLYSREKGFIMIA